MNKSDSKNKPAKLEKLYEDSHTNETLKLKTSSIQNEKRLRLSALITLLMFSVQLTGGIITNSLAILSDAWHLLSDFLALLLSWYAIKQTLKPANEKHTFGYHRLGTLAAFINGLTLIGISLFICYQSVLRIIEPKPIEPSGMMLFAGGGFVATFIIVLVLKDGEQNLNVKSALLHFTGDVLSYVGILIGGVVIYFTNWTLIDPILSSLFAIVILRNAWKITKEASFILLESVPETLSIHSIKKRLLDEPEIKKVIDLHVWSLSNEMVSLSTHLEIQAMRIEEMDEIIRRVERVLLEDFEIFHSTIQLQTENGWKQYDSLAFPHTH